MQNCKTGVRKCLALVNKFTFVVYFFTYVPRHVSIVRRTQPVGNRKESLSHGTAALMQVAEALRNRHMNKRRRREGSEKVSVTSMTL